MALVEPIVGHLLSRYKETVLDGFAKIRKNAATDANFSAEFISNPQGLDALRKALLQKEYVIPTLDTLCTLVDSCGNHMGCRSRLLREFCRGESFGAIKKALSGLSDALLPLAIAALRFLGRAAKYLPRVVLARFNGKVPLHLPCFRPQLPYTQRRLRDVRVTFLLELMTSKRNASATSIVCSHGFLTALMEDAAGLFLEGNTQGIHLGTQVLSAFDEHFVTARSVTSVQKRSVLLAQRNILRLLVKALDYEPVAEHASLLIHRVAMEIIEFPADYTSTRIEMEDRGMPNFLLFFLLRQLRPKCSARVARLVVFLLHKSPDLIRPYFTRISGHLADEGNAPNIAPSTAVIATINVMTRIFMAPLPYHLATLRVTLQPVSAKACTFYSMDPKDVADEVCPSWVAEFVHRIINGSSDLMMLALAMQMTHAALTRAKAVLALIQKIQQKQERNQIQFRLHARDAARDGPSHEEACATVSAEDEEMFCLDEGVEDWETYNGLVQAALLSSLPKREEFWHRMTQQIHPLLQGASPVAHKGGGTEPLPAKVEFIVQRMLLLMELYTDVFHLQISWLSAVPSVLPTFTATIRPIESALLAGNDILSRWSPASISSLCSLLVASLSRGTQMTKLHHITMTNPRGGITEWPLLLSLLLWAVRHRPALQDGRSADVEEVQIALGWVARLVQWSVHSVTVRFGCSLEEAMLWLMTLTEATLPCFLHVLNSVLQRSLSKAADRVANELFSGEYGVLAAAADAFIAKVEEKQAVASLDKSSHEGYPQASSKPSYQGAKKERREGAHRGAVKRELWSEDLADHLDDFKVMVAEVKMNWIRTNETVQHLMGPLSLLSSRSLSASSTRHGQRSITLAQQQMELQHEALLSVHEQLLTFCTTYRTPVPPIQDEDLELHAKVVNTATPLMHLHREGDAAQVNPMAYSADVTVCSTLEVLGVGRWCAMNSLCWAIAGRLLENLHEAIKLDGANLPVEDSEGVAIVRLFSMELLRSVIAFEAEARATLLERADDVSTGFYVLLLACLRVMLTTCGQGSNNAPLDLGRLEGLLMATYAGSTSTTDRVRYACMLSLHYGATLFPTDTASHLQLEPGKEAPQITVESGKASETTERTTTVPSRPFRGATVPIAIRRQRYLISNHTTPPDVTPEVDMLSLITDAWVDDEVLSMALECPSRLHTSLPGASANPAWDLLRSVFPEVTCRADLDVVSFSSITSSSVIDPRYFLPLLQTVLSLPAAYITRRYVGVLCLPLLIRALSFTDDWLRLCAAAALSSAHIPPGPCRIVLSFVRLKLLQLSHQRGLSDATGAPAHEVPRLPAPLSAWVAISIKPLGQFGDILHNPFVQFLLHTYEAFSTSVPFASWLQSFPLSAISAPLMIKRQEEMLRSGSSLLGEPGTLAQESAHEAITQLQKSVPPHLTLLMRILQYACQSNDDASALIECEAVSGLTLLCSMVTSSQDLRLSFVKCLITMCETSAAVARQLAVEGHLLLWLLSFSMQLHHEYRDRAHLYTEPVFMEVLRLIRIICAVVHPTLHRQGTASLAHLITEQLRLLRTLLLRANVTAKGTLDTLDAIIGTCSSDESLIKDREGALLRRHRQLSHPKAGSDRTKRPRLPIHEDRHSHEERAINTKRRLN